jgi:hypothetical protein
MPMPAAAPGQRLGVEPRLLHAFNKLGPSHMHEKAALAFNELEMHERPRTAGPRRTARGNSCLARKYVSKVCAPRVPLPLERAFRTSNLYVAGNSMATVTYDLSTG